MQSTAILVFANSSKEEIQHKPIQHGEALFDALTRQALKKIEKTTLTYFHVSEKEQLGDSFGERFTNAIQSIFNKGFKKVITIGNDTPHLRTEHLKAAAEALISGQTVLGPSCDGGFYLMGIHKNDFDSDCFLNLPWQQAGLFKSLINALQKKNCTIHKLPALRDIDDVRDIQTLSNFIRSILRSLHVIFAICLRTKNRITSVIRSIYLSNSVQTTFNKGSPSLHSVQGS